MCVCVCDGVWRWGPRDKKGFRFGSVGGIVFCCCFVCYLHVPVHRRDVVAGEHARLTVAGAFPPVGVGVVKHLDEVATTESEFALIH